MSPWLWVLGTAGVAAATPAVLAVGLARRALHPARRAASVPSHRPGIRMEPVTLAGTPGRRRGYLLHPAGAPRGAVLLVHGWGRDAGQMLPCGEAVAASGWTALALDLRGHGRSDGTGPVLLPHLAEDVRAGLEYLDGPGAPPGPRMGVGISMGAAALLVAATDGARFGGLSLSALFARSDTLARALLTRRGLPPGLLAPLVLRVWDQAAGEGLGRFEPLERIGSLRVPLLLAHGERDPLVPRTDFLRLQRAAPASLTSAVEIPGAGHGDLIDHPAHREALRRFLSGHEPLSPITG